MIRPPIRMSRRNGISKHKSIGIRLLAAFLSLIVCGIVIILITGQNPAKVYQGIIWGAVGTERRVWVTIRETIILLLIAVGLTPAFKMRFWNIGAEGQVLMGGLAAAAIMIYAGDKLPNTILLPLLVAASAGAGLVWALFPAVFKAKYNTNETLFTLMMNYVAMQIVTFAIVYWEKPKGSNTVGIINGLTKKGWFPSILGNSQLVSIIMVTLVTVLMYFYLKYTKHGYELTVVGESEQTARYACINVKRAIIRTVLLSGAICGMAGALIVSGSSHTISTSTAGGRGFTAIIVCWMAKFNPFVMILVSAFLVFMQQGAVQIASQYGLNQNASDIITGIVLFFLIGCEFFVNYKLERKKEERKCQC